MNKLLEDLKQKHPIKEVAPYGSCIVVPGPDFDPDFEVELGDAGYKCFDTFDDGKAVTLVRLKDLPGPEAGQRAVYHPEPEESKKPKYSKQYSKQWTPEEDDVLVTLWNSQMPIEKMPPSIPTRTEAAIRLRIQRLEKYGKIKKRSRKGRLKSQSSESSDVTKAPEGQIGLGRLLKGKDTPLGPRWTEDEYRLLIKLWNERGKLREIAANFPGRSGHAVGCAIARLRNSGIIKPRWVQKKNRFSRAEQPSTSSTPSTLSTPPSTPSPIPPGTPVKDEVVSLLRQILDAVKPKEELIWFEAYCPTCRDSRSVEDSNVWKACPVCGGPLIVWNVDAGREAPL